VRRPKYVLWESHTIKKLVSIPADAMTFRMRHPVPAATLVTTWDDTADFVSASVGARKGSEW
jgi:hypothetical protein